MWPSSLATARAKESAWNGWLTCWQLINLINLSGFGCPSQLHQQGEETPRFLCTSSIFIYLHLILTRKHMVKVVGIIPQCFRTIASVAGSHCASFSVCRRAKANVPSFVEHIKWRQPRCKKHFIAELNESVSMPLFPNYNIHSYSFMYCIL